MPAPFINGLIVGGVVVGFLFGRKSWHNNEKGLQKLGQKLWDEFITCLYKLRKDSKIRDAAPGETYDEYSFQKLEERRFIKFEFLDDNTFISHLYLVSDVGAIHFVRIEDRNRIHSIISVQGFEGNLSIADIKLLIEQIKNLG